MCWEVVSIIKDTVHGVGTATYRNPASNDCYEKRSQQEPPICEASDDPNAAQYLILATGKYLFEILLLIFNSGPVPCFKMIPITVFCCKHACKKCQQIPSNVGLSGQSTGPQGWRNPLIGC